MPDKSKKQFKAESQRLLDLMINSIYTHKEIFLREIISNASDAVDKLCYLSLTDSNVGMSRSDFAVTITKDKENRILTVSDNGIGMTKDELEANLGTIAKSGSLQFKKDMATTDDGGKESKEDIDIIGQFGVGFYSAFMVSDNVTVRTKAYGSDEAWEWQSGGTDGYTITKCNKDTVGTDILMSIKKDSDDEDYSQFLDEYQIVSLIKKYSDYIRYPIKMERERRKALEKKNEDDKTEYETYYEVETLNSMVPIWQRNKSEVTDEDYDSFYTEKFHDYEKPLLKTHVDAEGVVSYKALMFIPSKASYDYYTKDYQKGLQLYSSGVMIMERCGDLLPEYFRFVQGVVDSPDLSLNISRELLQHNRQLKIIATNLEKKIRGELIKVLANDREKYELFWKSFGTQIKYGMIADFGAHKENLQELLIFHSSDSEKFTTLSEYETRMKDGQDAIYFATGESVNKISKLPQTEKVLANGYEILYMTDDVDEFAIQVMRDYKGKSFKSINSGDLGLESDDEKKAVEDKQKDSKELLEFIKETLGDKVNEVKLSGNLVSHPVCLSAGKFMSFEMERYLSAVQPESGSKAERILELNPDHRVFQKLGELYNSDKETAKKYTQILYSQAALMAGLAIEDPASYSDLIFDLL